MCGGNVLQLFKAQELMALVVGNEVYDWEAFEENAEYKNGYSSGDQTVIYHLRIRHLNVLCLYTYNALIH